MADRPLYFDLAGEPISLERWEQLTLSPERVVACDLVGDDVEVCTTWFGVDLRCGIGDGPPLIFETMVFGGPLDRELMRYSSEEQARAGHARVLELVAEASTPADGGGGS